MTPMIIVLLLYLAILCVIAVHSAMNVKSVPDFFVARKGASVKAVAGSLVATILGGSAVIGAVDAGPKLGAATAWFMLVGSLGLLALLPFVKKAYTLGKYTLPDLIENLFGKLPRTIASIVIPLAWTGIVAAQIIAAAKLLQSFTPLNYEVSATISAIIFVFYTMAGGQLSILRTDLLQAILILAGLVIIVLFAIGYDFTIASSALGFASESPTLTKNAPAFPFNSNFTPLSLFLLILTYGSTFTVGPDMFSRLFCARDDRVAKKAILIAALILIPVAATIGFLGAFGTGLGEVQGARISAIADLVVPAPLAPFIALALLSVVLSSADTTLLSSSIIICELLFRKSPSNDETREVEKLETGKPLSETAENQECRAPHRITGKIKTQLVKDLSSLASTRYVILANGFVAFIIALLFTDIIQMLLLALAIYAGAFIIPILFGLAGMRIKPKFVSAAIIAGGLLALAGKLFEATAAASFTLISANAVMEFTAAHFSDILLIAAFAVNAGLLLIGRVREK